jgi:methylenetetrahydrofolate dehydrogenase (NADP+) / methenyltetrahydrofolate cyclohydrolase
MVQHLPASTSQEKAQQVVAELGQQPTVDGVLVQLPLPRQLDEAAVIDSLDPSKDVDGLHPLNIG